jgi:hypothetical protein
MKNLVKGKRHNNVNDYNKSVGNYILLGGLMGLFQSDYGPTVLQEKTC